MTFSSTRHIADDLHDLKCSDDAELTDDVRFPVRDIPALEEDLAFVQAMEAGDAAEERALACAVRPDDTDNLPLVHLERHILIGPQPAEVFTDALYIQ